MNFKNINIILEELGLKMSHRWEDWVMLKCPFAEWTHSKGTDTNPSFGIKINDTGNSGYHCFSADTTFLTFEGAKTFGDTVGTTQRVIGVDGKFVTAEIRHFGKQRIWELELSRNSVRKIIRTTEGHRWFAKHRGGGEVKETITASLEPMQRLQSRLPNGCSKVSTDSDRFNKGMVHGIVYGDGTQRKQRSNNGIVCLYGDKKQLSKWFSITKLGTTIREVEEIKGRPSHTRVSGPFGELCNTPPPLSIDVDYLYGFLAGYFGTDGHVSGNVVQYSSSRRHDLEFVRDAFIRLGIATYHIGGTMRKGYGKSPTALYTMNVVRSTLTASFFQRADQLAEFTESNPAYERLGWSVVSITQTNSLEDVYCAVVPDGNAFVLEDWILTGNCFTCKQKGRVSSLVRALAHYRDEDYTALAMKADMLEMDVAPKDFDSLADMEQEDQQPLDPSIFDGLYPSAIEVREAWSYLHYDRKISTPAAKQMGLLYDPEQKRILFPVRNKKGQLFGFSGRSILPPEKYPFNNYPKVRDYNGLKKEQHLLGAENLTGEQPVLLVEGLFAYARLMELGINQIMDPVASLGSALSDRQAATLGDNGQTVYILYDNDKAGDVGIFGAEKSDGTRSKGALDKLRKEVSVMMPDNWPEGKDDPDELTLEELEEMIDVAELIS